MLTCREVNEFLMSYDDGELPAAARTEFERHLAACQPCVAYLDSYRQTVRACQALGAASDGTSADVAIPEDLIKAILAARSAGDRSSD